MKFINFWTTLFLVFLVFFPSLSCATAEPRKNLTEKSDWELHRSATGVFHVKFPQKYRYNIFPFQFNDDTVAFSAEITGALDNKNGSNKSLLMKTVNTFGGEITLSIAKDILKKAAEKYVASAKVLDGVILANEDINHNGFMGKRLYISYKDGEKKQGLRIRIYVTKFAKVEQVLGAPANDIYSYSSDEFFNSLVLYDTIIKKENPVGIGWVDYTSKNGIFTAKLPPQNSNYTPKLPKFSTTPTKEVMRYKILDPVLDQDVIYNIYFYKKNEDFSYDSVKTILFTNNLAKFIKRLRPDRLKTENTVSNGTNIMKTKVVITPPSSYPHVNTVFLEARYKGSFLVVQELLTSPRHAQSGLNKTLFSQMKFHPEKYNPVQ